VVNGRDAAGECQLVCAVCQNASNCVVRPAGSDPAGVAGQVLSDLIGTSIGASIGQGAVVVAKGRAPFVDVRVGVEELRLKPLSRQRAAHRIVLQRQSQSDRVGGCKCPPAIDQLLVHRCWKQEIEHGNRSAARRQPR